MGIVIGSGIGATRYKETSPDFTFIWSASEQDSNLVVNCNFGGQTAQNNSATATIPWGSTTAVRMTNNQNNPAISVSGSVAAAWNATNTSYVVTFSGAMVEGNVNNVFSSNVNGVASEAAPIIVAVCVAS